MATITTDFADISALSGLKSLWDESLGNSRICVAVLDGPVDHREGGLVAPCSQIDLA
jgi:hypothetical protein